MDVGQTRWLIEAEGVGDVAWCRAELAAITSVRAMLAERELRVAQRLGELSADTDSELSVHKSPRVEGVEGAAAEGGL